MIMKFQQGGSSIPPLVSYQPVMVTSDGTSGAAAADVAGSSKSEGSSDLTDKDLLKMMEKLEGLPNDMEALTKVLSDFYVDQQYSPFPNTANIASRYLQALQMMRTANFNRKQYDEAYELVSKNGGINELAINEKGQLICANDKGDFKYVRPEELSQLEGYKPLTNSELLRFRAYSPELANDNRILGVVANGIGIEGVTKYIQQFITNLGTADNSKQGYAITQQGKVIDGITTLTQAIQTAAQQGIKFDGTTQDLYQYKILDKSQKDQADAALSYIYRMLPENAKSLLKVRTPSGTAQDAQKLIATIIASQIDQTSHYDVELKAGKTAQKAAKDSSTTKDTTEQETSLLHNIMQSIGGTDTQLQIDRGDGIQMTVNGSTYNRITTPNGEAIGDTSLYEMLQKSGLGSLVKSNQAITFGDQTLTPEQLRNVTYNGSGVVRANLPVKPDGTVNLAILEEYEQAEAEMKEYGDKLTPEVAGKILENHGLSQLLREDGKPDVSKFAPFIVTEGYTLDTNGIKDSDFVKKIKDPTEQQIQMYKRSLTVGTGKDKEVPDMDTYDGIWNPFDWFGLVDDLYKAAIYIPITNNQLTAVTAANQHIDYDEALSLEQKYQTFEKRANQSTTDASVLGI